MEIQSPPGATIGYVVQNWHPFLPKLSILGPSKEQLMRLEGPCCAISCCGDVDFVVRLSKLMVDKEYRHFYIGTVLGYRFHTCMKFDNFLHTEIGRSHTTSDHSYRAL